MEGSQWSDETVETMSSEGVAFEQVHVFGVCHVEMSLVGRMGRVLLVMKWP